MRRSGRSHCRRRGLCGGVGTHTMRCLNELEKSQWWSLGRIQQLRSERLQRLIHYAHERVPYYRALMDARGVSPGDIRTAADLSRLPVLTKSDVRQHASELLAEGFPRESLSVGRTGCSVLREQHTHIVRSCGGSSSTSVTSDSQSGRASGVDDRNASEITALL